MQKKRIINLAKKIASEEHIDPAIVLTIIEIESDFDFKAVSPAGARGLMQLTPIALTDLENRYEWNEMFDPEANIRAGVEYLKLIASRLGHKLGKPWYEMFLAPTGINLVIMAYNWGIGNVFKFLDGKINDIPDETKRYIVKFTQKYWRWYHE